MKSLLVWLFVLLGASTMAQKKLCNYSYQDRAQYMWTKVFKLYKIDKYHLFAEYYPNSNMPDVTYFQEGSTAPKEVSYLWPFSGLFSATNALIKIPGQKQKYLPYLDSMAMSVDLYLDTVRKPSGYQAYPVQFEKVDRYYDDNGLVGIDYVEAYKLTQNPVYLNRAKLVVNFLLSGWDEATGGGIPWLEGNHSLKPACSNGKAAVLCLKLFEASGDSVYYEWGLKFYNWMHQNLRDSASIYWNDVKENGEIYKVGWTYNTGTMLQSAVMLYKFTGKNEYLAEAKALAEGSYLFFGKKTSDGRISILDNPWFVTVLFRGYQDLYMLDHNPKYVNTIKQNVDFAWNHAMDGSGLIYSDWNATTDESKKAKWLLDEACMIELFARMALLNLPVE